MASFFLPSPPGKPAGTEDAYQELRQQAEAFTGSVSRDRRIQEIECRHHGLDSRLCVGECDANGQTVAAIVQLGRDTFTVHHVTAEHREPDAPMVLARTEVYSVTDFD
jgi:hypothetical protein